MNNSLFISGGIVFVILVILITILSMIKKIPKDKVMVITGFRQRTISGGIGIVIPVLERYDVLSLENLEIDVNTKNSRTSQGVPLDVDGYALIKVNNAKESVLSAMEQFYAGSEEKTKETITRMVKNVLEGKLREIISEMTVEGIYKDRQDFGKRVQEVAVEELKNMGLEVKSFTIKDIKDDNGYLEALGAKDIAEVQKNASVERAQRKKEEKVRISEEVRQGRNAEIQSETEIAEKERDKSLRLLEFKREQETARANSEIAYELELRDRKKELVDKDMNIEILKTQKEIAIQDELMKKKEKELDIQVRQPANAERYKAEQLAEAEKFRRIAEADAEAEEIKKRGNAEIELIKRRGEAEAEAIRLKGLAEAESMTEKAKAYELYGQAALVDMMREVLPELAKAVSEPLSKTEKIVIVDNGSDGNNSGAAKIANYSSNIISQVPELLKGLTGIDLIDMVSKGTKGSEDKDILFDDSKKEDPMFEDFKEIDSE